MDEKNNQNTEGQQGPSKKDIQKQDSRDVVNTVGKEAGKVALEAYGVPPVVSGMAVDKIAENPLVKGALNKVADNPLLSKGLSKAKPAVDAAKPLLNAKGGSLGKSGAGALKSTNTPLNNADPKPSMPKANNPLTSGLGAGGTAGGASGGNSVGDGNNDEPTDSQGSGSAGMDAAKDIANTVSKVKQYWPIISAIAPIVGYIFLLMVIVVMIMIPIMFVHDKIEEIKTGISIGWEKFLNLATGEGWNTNDVVFFDTLSAAYDQYEDYKKPGAESLDIPLIAATIHYSRFVDPQGYADGEVIGDDFSDNSAITGVGKNQIKSFYEVANDKLGSMLTMVPGRRRLLGHLVVPQITMVSTDILDAPGKWWDFAKFLFVDSTVANYQGFRNYPTDIITFFKFLAEVEAYAAMDQDKVQTDLLNVWYESKELYENFSYIFNAMDSFNNATSLGLFQVMVPEATLEMNTDNYKQYLEDIYIPLTYFHNKTYTQAQVTAMSTGMFNQKEAYEYLVNQYVGISNKSCGNCSYSITGINSGGSVSSYSAVISNLQVRLMQCSDLGTGTPIAGEELVPFEKYITGVVYAENGGAPLEAMKTQAVAARSYALSRAKLMGGSSGLALKEENGQWILQIRNCTEDQVYCDPDKGCSTESSTSATTFSGENTKPHRYKGPIAANDPIRTAVAETAGKVLLDADGNLVNAPYVNTDQEEWNDLADSGKTYTEILLQHYTNGSSISTSSCSNNCGASGDFTTWKQFGEPWSDIIIGSGESIGEVGCLVTSVAIQIARSGVAVNVADFNPGSFVEALKAQNKFYGANFDWYSTTVVAPTFQFQQKYLLGGEESTKYGVVKGLIDDGCYVVMEVKGNTGQHWVAVDYASDGTLYMMDPASTETILWNKYPSVNSSTAACYKVVN